MPQLMRILSSLSKKTISRPKNRSIKKIRLSEKCFDSDYEYSACKQMNKTQSHQEYMLEYYTKHGVGGK